MPTQSIIVQVGQCGNQIAHQFWKMAKQEFDQEPTDSFFDLVENKNNKNACPLPKARAVLIDTEESVVNRVLTSSKLYNNNCKITDNSGAGNNWAVGHYEYFPTHQENILEILRREAEKCDYLQSIFVLNSTGGGTGSGLGSAVCKILPDVYPESELFSFPVYPNKKAHDVITGPYNTLLATNVIQNSMHCVLPFDNLGLEDHIKLEFKNEILMKKSSQRLGSVDQTTKNLSTNKQGYDKMNSIIAKCILDITAHTRFRGPLNVDINEIPTNMIPFQNMNYLTVNSTLINKQHIKTAFSQGFSKNLNSSINLNSGVFMTACALLRSKKYDLEELKTCISHVKKLMKFPVWSLDSWKIGLTSHVGHDSVGQSSQKIDSLTSLTNSTATSDFLDFLRADFQNLFKRKAHLHHYFRVDGMEIDEFRQANENIRVVADCYKDVAENWREVSDFDSLLTVF